MDKGKVMDVDNQPLELELITQWVKQAAHERRADVLLLLELLRLLEGLHREVRETYFRQALPTNRQTLYNLLRDIEINGGWPYIQRMKLRSLLNNLENEEEPGQEEPANH